VAVWIPVIVLVIVWIGGSFLYGHIETRRVKKNPMLGPARELVRQPRPGRQDIRNDPGGETFDG
jgi:hypothetical protein